MEVESSQNWRASISRPDYLTSRRCSGPQQWQEVAGQMTSFPSRKDVGLLCLGCLSTTRVWEEDLIEALQTLNRRLWLLSSRSMGDCLKQGRIEGKEELHIYVNVRESRRRRNKMKKEKENNDQKEVSLPLLHPLDKRASPSIVVECRVLGRRTWKIEWVIR